MNVVVFGATGRTGLEVVKRALAAGHTVSAFMRESSRVPFEHPRLHGFKGSVFDPEAVGAAVRGQDAVVCALGAKGLGKTTVRAEGTRTVVSAMQRRGVGRLVVVSTLGAKESWGQLSPLERALFMVLLKNAKADHDRQEDVVTASGLDWTIVRPGELTDGEPTGRYSVATDRATRPRRVPRADVADAILKVLTDTTSVGQAVTLVGRSR